MFRSKGRGLLHLCRTAAGPRPGTADLAETPGDGAVARGLGNQNSLFVGSPSVVYIYMYIYLHLLLSNGTWTLKTLLLTRKTMNNSAATTKIL